MLDKINIFWFRRDLRLSDNRGLSESLNSGLKVQPIFIFDENILGELPNNDHRVNFIYDQLLKINNQLTDFHASINLYRGQPEVVWTNLLEEFNVNAVYVNHDYEPYAIKRDQALRQLFKSKGVEFKTFKDQVVFEKDEVVKDDGKPYTVYTPYKNKWLKRFDQSLIERHEVLLSKQNLKFNRDGFTTKKELGIEQSNIYVKKYNLEVIAEYDKFRDFPSVSKTSYLSPYLRFGTISIREMVGIAIKRNAIFLNELIWREFFMQILYHYPEVIDHNFKRKYDNIVWRNNEFEFDKWCKGETGYPLVDAGMRELNETGYMHNRVRMVVAGFLCKHLLIDWRWGEAYFAKKLFDFELASNNGNWQWAAGTGCDAAPYFRVFNPHEQLKKFDKDLKYVNKWVNNLNELDYPKPMVDHKEARKRAINTYKLGLS